VAKGDEPKAQIFEQKATKQGGNGASQGVEIKKVFQTL
jgi:hypothetical protein